MRVESRRYYHFTRDAKAESFMDASSTHVWTNETPNRRTQENQLQYSPRHSFQGRDYKHLEFLEELVGRFSNGMLFRDMGAFMTNIYYKNYELNARYWELIFEKVRAENYPELPSRNGCLYVVEDKNDFKEWLDKASDDGQKGFKFYELELTGQIHDTHGGWLELDVEPENIVVDNAHNYWRGEDFTEDSELGREILFCGESKVIAKYDSFDDMP